MPAVWSRLAVAARATTAPWARDLKTAGPRLRAATACSMAHRMALRERSLTQVHVHWASIAPYRQQMPLGRAMFGGFAISSLSRLLAQVAPSDIRIRARSLCAFLSRSGPALSGRRPLSSGRTEPSGQGTQESLARQGTLGTRIHGLPSRRHRSGLPGRTLLPARGGCPLPQGAQRKVQHSHTAAWVLLQTREGMLPRMSIV